MVEDELYQVAETCQYTTWASREIVCDRSYMEVSKCSRTLMGHVTVYMISGLIPCMSIKAGAFDGTAEEKIDNHLQSGLISRCLWKGQLQMIMACLNIPSWGLIQSLVILDELLRFDELIYFFI